MENQINMAQVVEDYVEPKDKIDGLMSIGDEVYYTGWGSRTKERVTVKAIEFTPNEGLNFMRKGNFTQILWSQLRCRSAIVDLEGGRWAYGNQLSKINK